jgi:hypothetical protein
MKGAMIAMCLAAWIYFMSVGEYPLAATYGLLLGFIWKVSK